MPELSLVLEVDGEIIGHVMYAWSHIDADDGRKIRMMTFGPISIRPDYKRKGYGKTLLDHSMRIAAEMGSCCPGSSSSPSNSRFCRHQHG